MRALASPPPGLLLTRLPRSHARNATLLLAASFLDDPFYRFACPDEARLRRWLPAVMRAALGLCAPDVFAIGAGRGGLGAGVPDGAGSSLDAVLAMTPPGRWPRGLAAEARALATIAAALPRARPPLGALLGGARMHALLERLRPAEPHHYICLAAVRPGLQGRGLGRALLEGAIAMAEGAPLPPAPVYLETTSPNNVPFYERFGFTVRHEARAPGGGPPVWTMARPVGVQPSTAASAQRVGRGGAA